MENSLSENGEGAIGLPVCKGKLNALLKKRSTEDKDLKSLIVLAWQECRRRALYLLVLMLCLPCAYIFVRILRYLSFDLT